MNYNEEQILEINKCREDIEYFADKYIKVSTAYGINDITLNDFQREVVQKYSKEKVFTLSTKRQKGKTTVAAIILLHQALFQPQRVSIIFARTKANSNYVIDLITEMYDRLPESLAISKITVRNKDKLEFDNVSSIKSAGSDANYGRGMTISTVYIDESDFISNLKGILTSLYPAMCTLYYTRIFALTTNFTGDTFNELGLKNG